MDTWMYTLIGFIYFSIGFFGFYHSSKKYGVINGFWGDLFVASCWGIFWPLFFIVVPVILWPFRKFEEKTGIYLDATSFFFSVFLVYSMYNSLLTANFPGFLILGTFLYILVSQLTTRPKLPKFFEDRIREDLDKMNKKVEKESKDDQKD